MQNTIVKDTLREYVKEKEVVFQALGSLVEVANEAEQDNSEEFLTYFDETSSVEIYQKGLWFIKDEFADFDGWATQDDVLFLLPSISVLIYVPKEQTIGNKLIAA